MHVYIPANLLKRQLSVWYSECDIAVCDIHPDATTQLDEGDIACKHIDLTIQIGKKYLIQN